MKRSPLLLLALVLASCALAQHGQRVHYFACDAALGPKARKPIMAQVFRLDPEARVSLDAHDLKIATHRGVGGTELLQALEYAGVGHFTALPGTLKADGPQAPADLPVYHDTGNPEADRAAYDAAKAAWREAHPTLYFELNGVTDTNSGE